MSNMLQKGDIIKDILDESCYVVLGVSRHDISHISYANEDYEDCSWPEEYLTLVTDIFRDEITT